MRAKPLSRCQTANGVDLAERRLADPRQRFDPLAGASDVERDDRRIVSEGELLQHLDFRRLALPGDLDAVDAQAAPGGDGGGDIEGMAADRHAGDPRGAEESDGELQARPPRHLPLRARQASCEAAQDSRQHDAATAAQAPRIRPVRP